MVFIACTMYEEDLYVDDDVWETGKKDQCLIVQSLINWKRCCLWRLRRIFHTNWIAFVLIKPCMIDLLPEQNGQYAERHCTDVDRSAQQTLWTMPEVKIQITMFASQMFIGRSCRQYWATYGLNFVCSRKPFLGMVTNVPELAENEKLHPLHCLFSKFSGRILRKKVIRTMDASLVSSQVTD